MRLQAHTLHCFFIFMLYGKDSDAGRDLGAGGEGDDRGWDGWMASPTWWMWVWVNSGRWWWTGRPGVLRFKESDTTEQLNWTDDTKGLPRLLSGKESACNAGDTKDSSLIPGSGRSPGVGKGKFLPFWLGKFHKQRRRGLQATGSQRIRHDWAHVHETKTTWKIKTKTVNESHTWRDPSFQSKPLPRDNSYFWTMGCACF